MLIENKVFDDVHAISLDLKTPQENSKNKNENI